MELAVEKRDLKKNPHTLRREGILPAVVYGRSTEATPVAVNRKEFEKVFHAAGESSVITLKGLGEEKQALINEVAVDAVSGAPIHADFYAIEKGQKVTVSVPLEFEGTSPAVKDKGAVLVKVIHEIEIECEPKDLPRAFVVDTSKLADIGSKILVSDLAIPAGATVSIPMDEVVAMTTEAKEEVEEAAPMDITQIDTSVERGKKAEDEVAGADAGGKAAPAEKASGAQAGPSSSGNKPEKK